MKKKKQRVTYKDVLVDKKPKSIWDAGVDYEKVMKLSSRDRHRLFPYDFNGKVNPMEIFN